MARRPRRSQIVHQLVTPVRARVRDQVPRIRRRLSRGQLRWPIARWVQRQRPAPGDGFKPQR